MLEEIRGYVDELFCSGKHQDLPRLLHIPDMEPETITDGYLYRFPMVNRADGTNVNLNVFADIGGLGGKLWEQEVRSLIRFSGSEHPAIPEIFDGDVRECSGRKSIGYVITSRKEALLDCPEVLVALRSDPLWTIRQIAVLADGLALMHRHGFFHRSLSAGAIEVERGIEPADRSLRLARFEMSTFQSNLLRWMVQSAGEPGAADISRMLPRDRLALAALPPERLAWLFADAHGEEAGLQAQPRDDGVLELPDYPQGDVYSLGVLGFQWLVDQIGEAHLEQAFPRRPGSGDAYEQTLSASGWHAFHRWMAERIRTYGQLPVRLRVLLGRMVSEHWRNRPTAAEVHDEIVALYDALAAEIGQAQPDQEHIVAIMPERFDTTFWRWGWLAYAPGTQDGLEELQEFIRDDLEGGFLEYCPDGFARIERGGDPDKEFATYVLRGRRAAYFACEFVDYRSQTLVPQVLLVKYVLDWSDSRARFYPEAPFQRRLPPVAIYGWKSDILRPSMAAAFPAWTPMLGQVRQDVARPAAHAEMDEALQWLLDVQRVEMDARQYAFRRSQGSPSVGKVELEFDSYRDADRIASNPLLTLYASDKGRRPAFDEFFPALESRNFGGYVSWWPSDGKGRPLRDRGRTGSGTDVERLGPNRIQIRTAPGVVVPEEGWLEPDEDGLNRLTHDRQARAREELMERPVLLGALTKRRAFFSPLARWEGVDHAFDPVDSGGPVPALQGLTSRTVLSDFLNSWPLYALQGPPGTGKTTIAARAIRATLARFPATRILVAAQSHYALDHLAATIHRWRPSKDVIAVRVVSEHREHRIAHADVEKLLPSKLTKETVKDIKDACASRVRWEPNSGLKEVAQAWGDCAEDSELEIRERLLRGANVVFTTCAGATPNAVGAGGDFDWVIIEEAAKAWPTELMIPLVRGQRWALLGDHQQLPAYRRREVGDFLKECALSAEPSLRRAGEKAKRFEEVFDLFARFFTLHPPVAGTPRASTKAVRNATGRLVTQYRMAEPIADLVSSAFYEGVLETAPNLTREHGLASPPALEGKSLVWLDTSELKGCYEERQWKNRGEARVVRALLEKMVPQLRKQLGGPQRERQLAILSPYRQQNELLERELNNAGLLKELSGLVHTVDAFQGREADIVVVSLVRDSHLEQATVTERLGHLIDQQRINVLFSRARALLVLVGDLEHFRGAAELASRGGDRTAENARGAFWRTICEHVRGRVADARRIVRADDAEGALHE
jgi:hypothetical protein